MEDSKIGSILRAGNVRPAFRGEHETKYYLFMLCLFLIFVIVLFRVADSTNFIRSIWPVFVIPVVVFEFSKRYNAKIYLIKESSAEVFDKLLSKYLDGRYGVISKSSRYVYLKSAKGSYFPKNILLIYEKGKIYGASWATLLKGKSFTNYGILYSGKKQIRKMKEYTH